MTFRNIMLIIIIIIIIMIDVYSQTTYARTREFNLIFLSINEHFFFKIYRCVPHNQRSYALAFQTFLHVLLGLLPGRLIKYIMDLDCNIWQTDQCGRKGICWDYKANSMSKSMTIFALLATGIIRFDTDWVRNKRSDERIIYPELLFNNLIVLPI